MDAPAGRLRALGDIGHLFPDRDPAYRGAAALLLDRWFPALRRADARWAMWMPPCWPRPHNWPLIWMRKRTWPGGSRCPVDCRVKATTEGALASPVGDGITAHAVCLVEGNLL